MEASLQSPATPKLSAISAEPATMRDKILHAAIRLFRQKGFAAVSIQEIVSEVGITKPALYYYFTDKDALYTQALITMMANGYAYIDAFLPKNDPLQAQLVVLTRGYFEFSPTSLGAMLRDGRDKLKAESFKQVITANERYMIDPFAQLFNRAMERGDIAGESGKELALMFISLMDTYVLKRALNDGRTFDYQGYAERVVDVFLNGVAVK